MSYNNDDDFSFDFEEDTPVSPAPFTPNLMSNDMTSDPGYDSPFMQSYSPEDNSMSRLESNDELMQRQAEAGSTGNSRGFRNIAITAAVLCFMGVVVLLGVNWFLNRQKDQPPVQEPVQQEEIQQQPVQEPATDYSALKNNSSKAISDNSLLELTSMPNFSDIYTSKGMIMEKGMVEVAGKNTYIPYLTLTIVGQEKATDIQYYCNGATYEAVRIGETLDVDYRIDSDYKIVIQQVSTN